MKMVFYVKQCFRLKMYWRIYTFIPYAYHLNVANSSCASPSVIISAGNLLTAPFPLMKQWKLQPAVAFFDCDRPAQWPLFSPVHISPYNEVFCRVDSVWYHAGNYLDEDHMLFGHAVSKILLLLIQGENVKPPIDNKMVVCSLRTHQEETVFTKKTDLLPFVV